MGFSEQTVADNLLAKFDYKSFISISLHRSNSPDSKTQLSYSLQNVILSYNTLYTLKDVLVSDAQNFISSSGTTELISTKLD